MREQLSRLVATRAHLRRPLQRDFVGTSASPLTPTRPGGVDRADGDRWLSDECGREWVVRQLPTPAHPALAPRRGVTLLYRCPTSASPPLVVRAWASLATLSDDDLLSRLRIAED